MEATKDLSRSGDYVLRLATEEVKTLRDSGILAGELLLVQTGQKQACALMLVLKRTDDLHVLRATLKQESTYFSASARVIVVCRDALHTIYHEREVIDFERLLAEPLRYASEYRCDDILGRKIFIYHDPHQK